MSAATATTATATAAVRPAAPIATVNCQQHLHRSGSDVHNNAASSTGLQESEVGFKLKAAAEATVQAAAVHGSTAAAGADAQTAGEGSTTVAPVAVRVSSHLAAAAAANAEATPAAAALPNTAAADTGTHAAGASERCSVSPAAAAALPSTAAADTATDAAGASGRASATASGTAAAGACQAPLAAPGAWAIRCLRPLSVLDRVLSQQSCAQELLLPTPTNINPIHLPAEDLVPFIAVQQWVEETCNFQLPLLHGVFVLVQSSVLQEMVPAQLQDSLQKMAPAQLRDSLHAGAAGANNGNSNRANHNNNKPISNSTDSSSGSNSALAAAVGAAVPWRLRQVSAVEVEDGSDPAQATVVLVGGDRVCAGAVKAGLLSDLQDHQYLCCELAALQQSRQLCQLQVFDVAHMAWRLQVACQLGDAKQTYEQEQAAARAASITAQQNPAAGSAALESARSILKQLPPMDWVTDQILQYIELSPYTSHHHQSPDQSYQLLDAAQHSQLLQEAAAAWTYYVQCKLAGQQPKPVTDFVPWRRLDDDGQQQQQQQQQHTLQPVEAVAALTAGDGAAAGAAAAVAVPAHSQQQAGTAAAAAARGTVPGPPKPAAAAAGAGVDAKGSGTDAARASVSPGASSGRSRSRSRSRTTTTSSSRSRSRSSSHSRSHSRSRSRCRTALRRGDKPLARGKPASRSRNPHKQPSRSRRSSSSRERSRKRSSSTGRRPPGRRPVHYENLKNCPVSLRARMFSCDNPRRSLEADTQEYLQQLALLLTQQQRYTSSSSSSDPPAISLTDLWQQLPLPPGLQVHYGGYRGLVDSRAELGWVPPSCLNTREEWVYMRHKYLAGLLPPRDCRRGQSWRRRL